MRILLVTLKGPVDSACKITAIFTEYELRRMSGDFWIISRQQLKVSIYSANIHHVYFFGGGAEHTIANHLGSMIICYFHSGKDKISKEAFWSNKWCTGLGRELLKRMVIVLSMCFKIICVYLPFLPCSGKGNFHQVTGAAFITGLAFVMDS